MVAVLLDSVTVRFASVPVVESLTLRVEDGEALALLGPSGSGKTTVLRALAGLTEPDSGDVMFDMRRMNGVRPADRNIAMVFQENVLFPRMDVRGNVSFPLRVRKVPAEEIASRVLAETRAVGIANLLERDPHQLSAGEQHLVQIARAMVRRPDLLLVDEPFVRLDPINRARLRGELRLIQTGYGVTALYATHDYVDAMSLADRVAILDEGKIRQVGTPAEIYDRPADMFVASFVGSPQMGFLDGEATSGGVDVGGLFFSVPGSVPRDPVVGVRPEDWVVAESGIEGVVARSYPLGPDYFAEIDTGSGSVTTRFDEKPPDPGDHLYLRPREYHVFSRASGRAVYHSAG